MAQSTVLASSTDSGTSTDITVAAGAVVTVGLYADAGSHLDGAVLARVWQDTPGADNFVCLLTNGFPSTVLSGPGTFRVIKEGNAHSYGVFTET